MGVFLSAISNLTSGYILLIRKDDVIELDMLVEQEIKMIISMVLTGKRKAYKNHADQT